MNVLIDLFSTTIIFISQIHHTVIFAVGLVDSNWILAMDMGHSVVLFGIVGCTVQCNVVLCVTCHESNLGECFG